MKRRLLYLLPFIALALSFPGSGGAYEGPIKHGWGFACQSCHTGTITPGNGPFRAALRTPRPLLGPGTNVFFFEAWSARQISGAWVGDTTKKSPWLSGRNTGLNRNAIWAGSVCELRKRGANYLPLVRRPERNK
jgi:hypothetical protein